MGKENILGKEEASGRGVSLQRGERGDPDRLWRELSLGNVDLAQTEFRWWQCSEVRRGGDEGTRCVYRHVFTKRLFQSLAKREDASA
eukprot:5984703-Pleurochrysis_carterae.AAC.2